MATDTIINAKTTKEFKEVVRKAAFHAGYNNTSQFILALLNRNVFVKKELEKKVKKVA